ncbi:MAG: hypothetical protein ACOCX5_02930, partial [Chloroflexota bacterium]
DPHLPRRGPVREGWLRQLFFGEMLDREALLNLLVPYRAETDRRIRVLEAIDGQVFTPGMNEQQTKGDVLRHLTLDYGLIIQKAALVGWHNAEDQRNMSTDSW